MQKENYEPKMANRFYVEFPEEIKEVNFFVEKMNRPAYIFTPEEDEGWDTMKIVFRDCNDPSVTNSLYNFIDSLKKKKRCFSPI